MTTKFFLTAFAVIATTSAYAQVPVTYANKPSLEAEFNYSLSSVSADGSAKNSNSALNAKAAYRMFNGDMGFEFGGDVVRNVNSADGVADINRIRLHGKVSEFLEPSAGRWYGNNAYVYGKLQLEKDDASGYDFILTPSVGYGRNILRDRVQTLDVEVGAGAQYINEKGSDSDFQLVLTGDAEYRRKFNNIVSIEQDIGLEYGGNIRTLRWRTALVSQLYDNIAAQASYNLKITNTDYIDSRDSVLGLGLRYTN